MRQMGISACGLLMAVVALAMGQQAPPPGARETPNQPAIRPKDHPIPDTFTNLQVLPKDISKPQLVSVMKQFSMTFNVRCLYCHAVSDDLTEGSFDSDEKETKRKARELLKAIYAAKDQPKPTPGAQ